MGFTLRMENRALELSAVMRSECPEHAHLYIDRRNVRPWFSSPFLFERSAARVFLATNPGGHAESDLKDLRLEPGAYDCGESGLRTSPHNCWLDDVWAGSPVGQDKQRQVPVQRAFEALYGSQWESILRETPSFEVCPLRSSEVSLLPKRVWDESIDWCHEILEHLSPKFIVTNGNSERRSPWQAIQQMYRVDALEPLRVMERVSLKAGRITSGKLKGAMILGMPHLSRFGGEPLFGALREFGSVFGNQL